MKRRQAGPSGEQSKHARVCGALSAAAYSFQRSGDREGAERLRDLALVEWTLAGDPRRPAILDDPDAGGPR